MAHDHPECHVTAFDLVEAAGATPYRPKNYSFFIHNVLDRFPCADNSYDLVHMGFMSYALREDDWPVVLKELFRVTKPGGRVQLMEMDDIIYYMGFVGPVGSKLMNKGELYDLGLACLVILLVPPQCSPSFTSKNSIARICLPWIITRCCKKYRQTLEGSWLHRDPDQKGVN